MRGKHSRTDVVGQAIDTFMSAEKAGLHNVAKFELQVAINLMEASNPIRDICGHELLLLELAKKWGLKNEAARIERRQRQRQVWGVAISHLIQLISW